MGSPSSSSLCVSSLNSSCWRPPLHPPAVLALFYSLLFLVCLLTVSLNLLVIISVLHFRRLHTCTNVLLASLAGADLLVGVLVMPVEGLRYLQTCWLLGRLLCRLTPLLSFSVLSASVGHMLLLCVDRYLAVCHPLLYSSRLGPPLALRLVGLVWAASFLYNAAVLHEHLFTSSSSSSSSSSCDCEVVVSLAASTVDLVLALLLPCSLMLLLYTRVFLVAVTQARAIRRQVAQVAQGVQGVQRVQRVVVVVQAGSAPLAPVARRAELKAARTLGVVVLVFLLCFCPFYYPVLLGQDSSSHLSYLAALTWVALINSCINPLLYALFYRWFRRAAHCILTLRILQPGSQDASIL